MNWTKILRKISTAVLLISVTIQLITVILMFTGFEFLDIGELHEICGFIFFSMVLVHIFIFRKSLKNMLFPQQ